MSAAAWRWRKWRNRLWRNGCSESCGGVALNGVAKAGNIWRNGAQWLKLAAISYRKLAK